MRSFTYERAASPAEAAKAVATTQGAKFIAGGTNLIDLMKLEIETPTHLVDVQDLGLDQVEDYAQRKGIPRETAERWLAPNLGYDARAGYFPPARRNRRSLMDASRPRAQLFFSSMSTSW